MMFFYRIAVLLTAFSTAACGVAQDETADPPKPKPKAPVSAPVGNQPATKADVKATLYRAETAIREVLGLPALKPMAKVLPADVAPATRSELILGLNQIFKAAQGSFKFTPRFVQVPTARITLDPKDPARPALENLIRWQCIAKLGPLATNSGKGFTLMELGDATGFCLARIADLTHMPSTRWSPNLTDGSGTPQKAPPNSSNGESAE